MKYTQFDLELWFEIERHFEISQSEVNPCIFDYVKQLESLRDHYSFESFYEFVDARIGFLNSQSNLQTHGLELGFNLVWGIIASEIQYNLNRRAEYLKLFENHIRFFRSEILSFYLFYFRGTTHAFEGRQIESLACYSKAIEMAQSIGYILGLVRAKISKAIILDEMGQSADAQTELTDAQRLSFENGFERSQKRIFGLLYKSQKQSFDVTEARTAILSLFEGSLNHLLKNENAAARQMMVQGEILRRSKSFLKDAFSFYALFSIFLRQRGRLERSKNLLMKLSDPVLKYRCLRAIDLLGLGLSAQEQIDLKSIEREIFFTNNKEEIRLQSIKQDNIRRLVSFLNQSSEPMTKEVLFEKVYEIVYDPVLHDNRLYKLINQTRTVLGNEIIVNGRGVYGLNREKYKVS